jgi:2-iminobutanoate/2-iminopropanoate deaminase
MSSRKVISTSEAPSAIGPYSQAVEISAQRMVFLSGQIPLNPATQEMEVGDISAQTERVMQNLEAVLKASSMTFADVVKCGIFLIDMADFAAVNAVYSKYFSVNPPARATVAVSALPRGSRVEIDAIAVA